MLSDEEPVSCTGSQSLSQSLASTPAPDLGLIHRFTVQEVEKWDGEVVLYLKAGSSPFTFRCTLTGTWINSRIAAGDIVNVFSRRYTDEQGFVISDTDGFVVINPDNLITCTAVASTLFCGRKSWLSDKFRGWGVGNKIMLIGTLVHELIQACCVGKIHTEDGIKDLMNQLLSGPQILLSAYLNEMTEKELINEVSVYIPWIQTWLAKYVTGEDPGELHGESRKKLKILKFHDIEDNIWCHYNGTKGKVDFTVEVRIHEKDFTTKKAVLPMELKTGKASFSPEHEAQATLYSMMMHDRQFGECDSALLMYIKDGPKMKHVVPSDHHRIALIQRRNEHEFYTRQQVVGPDFKDSQHFCSMCDHALDCCLMARNYEPEKLESASNMPFISHSVTEHLSDQEVQFFGDWVTKLYAKQNSSNMNNDFWNESAESREEQGLALAGMRILRSKKFTYTFERCSSRSSTAKDLASVVKDWNLRDRVAISLDQQPENKREMIAILTGFIQTIANDHIICTFDKSLQQSLEGQVFRIDRLARSSSAFLSNFTSLLRLMSRESSLSQQLRDSVISRKEHSNNVQMRQSSAIVVKSHVFGSDPKVKKAIARSLMCSHYALFEYSEATQQQFSEFVTIFARIVLDLKKSLLITSASQSAVDRVLTSLKSGNVSFLRLQRSSGPEDEWNEWCEEIQISECKTVSQIQKIYESTLITASTIYGIINHPYFELKKQHFDYCILLDGDQPLLTQSLAPLFRCEKFLLIRRSESESQADNLFSHLQSHDNVWPF